MVNPKVAEKIAQISKIGEELVEVKVQDITFKFGVLTVAEEIMIRKAFERAENVSPDEVMIEQVLYALREIDGEPVRAIELDEETKGELRELFAGLPRVIVRQMHTKILFTELEQETRIGLQQLRQVLLSTGLLQLTPLVPFPITLRELAEVLSQSSNMEEVIERLQALEGKYVEAFPAKAEEEKEQPTPTQEEVGEAPTSEEPQPAPGSEPVGGEVVVEEKASPAHSREEDLARRLTNR